MGRETRRSERIRTALFVDFDNIQINLADDDRDAATAFARNPERWVDWLSQRAAPLYPDNVNCSRKIILRRCYMNPQRFSDFRPDFIRNSDRSLNQKTESAENLAEIMGRWVLGLCRTSRLNLNKFEIGMVRQWLGAKSG